MDYRQTTDETKRYASPFDVLFRIDDNNIVTHSFKGTNPSYASPQGIEPSFDISHERIKGEHNREKIRKKLLKQESTTPPTARSTPSTDKHVVVSNRPLLYNLVDLNLKRFVWFLTFNNLLSDLFFTELDYHSRQRRWHIYTPPLPPIHYCTRRLTNIK